MGFVSAIHPAWHNIALEPVIHLLSVQPDVNKHVEVLSPCGFRKGHMCYHSWLGAGSTFCFLHCLWGGPSKGWVFPVDMDSGQPDSRRWEGPLPFWASRVLRSSPPFCPHLWFWSLWGCSWVSIVRNERTNAGPHLATVIALLHLATAYVAEGEPQLATREEPVWKRGAPTVVAHTLLAFGTSPSPALTALWCNRLVFLKASPNRQHS